MASGTSVVGTNGNFEQKVFGKDVKILVVGDRRIGKTSLIRTFVERFGNRAEESEETEGAKMFSAVYDVDRVPRYIKIFEIFGGTSAEQIDTLTKDHYDNYGIIFMFAIDNPLSCTSITDLWVPTMVANQSKEEQPCILVGNKRDLRENQQVINRLAMNNQAPVSSAFGEALREAHAMAVYFETSSIDENDTAIHTLYNFIIESAIPHYIADTGAE